MRFSGRAGSMLAALIALAIAASCGGGGVVGSGGTGRPTGVSVGTVNGFGSVIVDGLSYDDRSAPVVSEVAPGVDTPADLKFGHRVSVGYETSGVASSVRVDAALAGPVASAVSASQLSVLGQTVTVNSSGTAGPITQFGGGYTQAADVRAGDAIEVHGLFVRQAAGYVIQATRIDRLAAAPNYLRVSGLVSGLASGSTVTFSLGALTVDATGAPLLPAGSTLANGQTVTVLALPATLTTPAAGGLALQAAQVRIRELRGDGLDNYVSGSVSQLDSQGKTFSLGSLRVNYASASVLPATATLATGRYVQVRGMVGADGVLAAAAVTIRDAGSDTEAELKGNVSGYVPASKQFSVRGVAVDASRATLQGCPAAGLSDGLFVELEGSVSSTGVVARQVQCENEPSGATVEREGLAGAVDVSAKTFTVTRQGTVTNVKWTDNTFFGGTTPQTMAGKQVHVEGQLAGGVLMASKVSFDD